MIKPNMATMLAYVATDAVVNEELLHRALTLATEKSFNRITVDSDTSTNDSVVLVATGASGVTIDEESFDSFLENLCQVFTDLAQGIISVPSSTVKSFHSMSFVIFCDPYKFFSQSFGNTVCPINQNVFYLMSGCFWI